MIEEYWSCKKCEKEGPYYGDDFKYPSGWKFSLVVGLVCPSCAKKYNIKISDVEQEITNNDNIEKISWECL